ncbi:hypothetical protein EAO70_05970 [Streptomyces sp. adm13(2018)]|uniref:hypothetical protein n=1 Tax=Streptomyces sp. adm13(2018) TaxID=2479007 RepID=UPI0011CD4364|nr:hypothetical protein [Streptomyces sp. adm13(2018)]TXS22405.1 hypothetical protein EAO70_05970 [Streptomyces sp. adm13(2018)]
MASFTDDFNRADSSNLGAGWVQVSGFWAIASNQLSPGSDGGTIILRAAGPMDSSDHSAQVTIAATTAASHGVWCRGNSNISNGYLWRNDGSEWTLFSVVSGTFTAIGSYAAAAAPGNVAKVQAVGSTIKAFVNGVQRVSVTDTAVASGTSVGLRSVSTAAIRFDDFAAADVTAGVTLGIAAEADNAQGLASSKAGSLGATLEADTAQSVAGAKMAALTAAAAVETAQALTGAISRSLTAATATETAQLLTGAKTSVLGVAIETSTARPLTAAGGDGIDRVAAGTPHSLWTARRPRTPAWSAGTPRT